mgnify:CR=1 FL=1
MRVNVILSEKPWHAAMVEDLRMVYTECEWILIDKRSSFTERTLKDLNPDYVFIPHWSYILTPSIYNNFECIIFHMTDLPYGRGGSPLQNLIARGHEQTQISAIRCVKEVDGGPIYLKRPLALAGTAEEIFRRAAYIIKDMILEIADRNPTPSPQQGEIVKFLRRSPQDSNVGEIDNIESLYDHIRMLQCEGYPPAFLDSESLHFTFSNAIIDGERLVARVEVTLKGK